jgi:hypothetical protein
VVHRPVSTECGCVPCTTLSFFCALR